MYVALKARKPAFILGIDPGYANCGWGIVDIRNGAAVAVCAGCITTKPNSGVVFWARLTKVVEESFSKAEAQLGHDETFAVAMEGYDFYPDKTKQHATTDKHNAVMGAIWGGAIARGLEVAVYSPRESKNMICGDQRADKSTVMKLVELRLRHKSGSSHEADSLLIAEAHSLGRAIALRTMQPPCIGEVKLI